MLVFLTWYVTPIIPPSCRISINPSTNIVCLGQDLAPDIYETPDLTDEASTVPVSYPA